MLSQRVRTTAFVFIILMGVGVRAVHGEWTAIEPHEHLSGLQTVYIDLTTLRRDGPFVTFSQLTDFGWQQGGKVGRRFLSTKTQKQFDCPAKRYRLLAFTDFSGHMGTGTSAAGHVDREVWLPVLPESLNHTLWELACSTPR